MRILLLCVAVVLCLPIGAECAPRSRVWKDQEGNEIKAEFTGGVLEGRVVLRQDRKRLYLRLSAFSLEDRDYIIAQLKSRKSDDAILQLMQFESQPESVIQAKLNPPAAIPAVPGVGTPTLPAGPNFPGFRPSPTFPTMPTMPVPVDTPPVAGVDSDLVAPADRKTVYGIKTPSPGLLQEDPLRRWTDLNGGQMTAVFEQVVEPKHLRLRMPDGTVKDLAMVNFVKEDFEYVQDVLNRDWELPVFPAGDYQPLTSDDLQKGYRMWTDRKGEKLNAKFVRVEGKKAILEFADAETSYSRHGLSFEDQSWINRELARRAEEARQKAEAARAAAEAASRNNSGGNSSPFGSRFGPFGNRPSYNPGMGSHNDGSSPRSGGSIYNRPVYEFDCPSCGHHWTNNHSLIDNCPKCASNRNHSMSNNSSPNYGNTGSHSSSRPNNSHSGSGYSGRSSSYSGDSGIPGSGDWEFECLRCHHKWRQHTSIEPDECPSCHNNGPGFSGLPMAAKILIGLVVTGGLVFGLIQKVTG